VAADPGGAECSMIGEPPMATKYLLAQMFLSSEAEIELSRSEYDLIIEAIDKLLECLDAEDKFDCLLENYRDLEKFMVDQAFESMFSRFEDGVAFQVPRNTTARKLSNFLSSVRLYQDTVGRHAKSITNDEAIGIAVGTELSQQFDSSLSYRVLDALRNYAQHQTLPVHGFSMDHRWVEDHAEHEFQPVVNVKELARNPDFRKKTLAEIVDGPEALQLKPMIRDYVESLSTIHEEFRGKTQSAVDRHLATIASAKTRLFAQFPETKDIGLAVFEADDEGLKVGNETGLNKTLHEYLDFLRKKNRHLVSFARRRIAY
jgi:hypothetical protein